MGLTNVGQPRAGLSTLYRISRKSFRDHHVIAKLRKAYAMDFAVWDEIGGKNRSVCDIAKGRDLRVVQEYCKQKPKTS